MPQTQKPPNLDDNGKPVAAGAKPPDLDDSGKPIKQWEPDNPEAYPGGIMAYARHSMGVKSDAPDSPLMLALQKAAHPQTLGEFAMLAIPSALPTTAIRGTLRSAIDTVKGALPGSLVSLPRRILGRQLAKATAEGPIIQATQPAIDRYAPNVSSYRAGEQMGDAALPLQSSLDSHMPNSSGYMRGSVGEPALPFQSSIDPRMANSSGYVAGSVGESALPLAPVIERYAPNVSGHVPSPKTSTAPPINVETASLPESWQGLAGKYKGSGQDLKLLLEVRAYMKTHGVSEAEAVKAVMGSQ